MKKILLTLVAFAALVLPASAYAPQNNLFLELSNSQILHKGEPVMLEDVQAIHLEDASLITLRYLDRFTVQLPWASDLDYKLNYLQAVVERLEDNEKGTINMMQDHKVNFIPD